MVEACLRLGMRDHMEFYRMPPTTQALYVEHVINGALGLYQATGRRKAPQSQADADKAWQRFTQRGDP